MGGNTLIETTEKRLIYFGAELREDEANMFVFNIFGDTL